MTPEGRVKAKVQKLLHQYGVYFRMYVPSGYGAQGLDFTCCYRGLYFEIETKADATKKMTARQKKTARDVERAGGIVFLVYDEITLAAVDQWLHRVSSRASTTETAP